MTSEELINIATRHAVFLERLKSKEANETAKAIAYVEGAIVDLIRATDVDSLSELNFREFRNLLKRIETAAGKSLDKSIDGMLSRFAEIANYEAGFEARAIEGIGKGVSLKVPTEKQLETAVSRKPIPASGNFVVATLARWKDKSVAEFADTVRRGYTDGLTVPQIVKKIRGTKANRFLDGVGAKSRRDAMSVTRTAVQHYSQVGREELWKRNEDVVTGYRFVATLDARTTTECRSLDGKVFKVGEGRTPPVHYNCRSVTVPELGSEFDFLDEDATRAARGGPVPANMTYYEWLKTQSAEFQDKAIGPTRGKLFRDGGLSAERFEKLQRNNLFEPLTLTEMRELEPLAFKRAGLPQN